MSQTTKQQVKAIRFGSCLFEAGATVGTLVNMGVLRDANFKWTFTPVEVDSDNGGVISRGVTDEEAVFSANAIEFNLDRWSEMFSGLLTKTVVAGAPTPVTAELLTFDDTEGILLAQKNGAGTEVASIVLTNLAGTMTYLRDCDYVVSVDAAGNTVVARAYPTAIATAQTDIDAANGDSSYNDGSGNLATVLAPGDHIIVAGFTTTANNGVKTVVSATASKIIVAEAVSTEAAGDTITITRGAIADAGTAYAAYSYTPNSYTRITAGGKITLNAQVVRFTNRNAAGKDLICTIYSATPTGGIELAMPSDKSVEPWLVPIELTGKCDVDRAEGDQLFVIDDYQNV